VTGHADFGAGATDAGMVPFERHPASLVDLETLAERFGALAERGLDLDAVTGRRLVPAEAGWHGMAAGELRAAPRPVRERAARVVGALAWASGPVRFWAEQVRLFNAAVERIEVERVRAHQAGWGAPEGEASELARGEHEKRMRDRWWDAHRRHIEEGARSAAAMLRGGPTAEDMSRLADAGAWRAARGAAAAFLPRWRDQAMERLATELVGLAARIADPASRPTVEELRRLAGALRRYAGDSAFAYHLLAALGPAGLFALVGEVALVPSGAGGTDRELAGLAGAVQAGLGVALATATTPLGGWAGPSGRSLPAGRELAPGWLAGLLRLGREKIFLTVPAPAVGGISAEVYGHQLLGVLLQAPGARFDSDVLARIGGDLVRFETAGGWSTQAEGVPVWPDTRAAVGMRPVPLNWVVSGAGNDGYDPMVGLLSALRRDPEAARLFFTGDVLHDGTPGGRLPRVGYLLTDRFWPGDLSAGGEPAGSGPGLLGEALRSAATVDPDGRSDRIVEAIVRETAHDEEARGYPDDHTGRGRTRGRRTAVFRDATLLQDELRAAIAGIVSHYIDDVHWSMAGVQHPDAGVPHDKSLRLDSRDLQVLLAELGKNLQARDRVRLAEELYATVLFDHYLSGGGGQVSLDAQLRVVQPHVITPAAGVVAALDVGAASELRADWQAEQTSYNGTLHIRALGLQVGVDALASFGKGTTGIGTLIDGLIDHGVEAEQAQYTGVANHEVGNLRERTRESLSELAELAAYHNLDPDQLPADIREVLVGPDGELKPMPDWHGRDASPERLAWDSYLTSEGGDSAGFLRDQVARGYDAAFTAAKEDIEGEIGIRQ
jgi:hypothetical protein